MEVIKTPPDDLTKAPTRLSGAGVERKTYEKPGLVSQKVFETTSLGCGLVEYSGGGSLCDFVQQYY